MSLLSWLKRWRPKGCWEYHTDGDPIHVWPPNDRLPHELEDGTDCWCDPIVEPIKREDGSVGWLVTHNAADGRP